MSFKAIIFDLDGTLLDTLDDLADSMNHVLQSYGYPIHDIEKYKYFVGNGLWNLVKRALPEGTYTEEIVDKYLEEMNQQYAVRWADKTRPYKGIPELLNSLHAKRIILTVLSNKPHEFTTIMIEKLLPGWKFDVVFGERKEVPRKPDPSGALEICHFLNLEPSEVLYIGDTNTDMQTANAAGMYAIGVLWGFREADELLESGANVLVKEPLEILKLL